MNFGTTWLVAVASTCAVQLATPARLAGCAPAYQVVPDCTSDRKAAAGGFRRKPFREDGLTVTVRLGPCVSDDQAWQMLRGIRDGRLVNGQKAPPHPIADRVLPPYQIPIIDVSRVTSIERTRPHERYLLEGVPPSQFKITTTDSPTRFPTGLVVYVIVRDGDLEVVGAGRWEV